MIKKNELKYEEFLELVGLLSEQKVSFIDKEAAIQVGQVGIGRLFPVLEFCSPRLRNDKSLISYLVTRNIENLKVVDEKFKDDEDIVWRAIENDANAFQYASPRLKDNEGIVKYTLKHSFRQIEHVSDRFGKNKELIIELLKKEYKAFEYINQEMKNDIDVLKAYWEYIRDEFYIGQESNYHLWFFIEHLGDNVKRFFSIVSDDRKTALAEVQTAFDNLKSYLNLPKELSEELSSSKNAQPKKFKI